MLLRVGNFFSGSFFFPAFSLILLPPIIFSYLCFCLSSFPVSPDLPFFFAAPVAMVIVWFSTLFVPLFFPCASFWIFLAPLIHLSHFSYFQHLYVFPDFKYQRIFSKNSGAPFSFRHLSGFFFLFIAFLFFNTSFAILLLATLWNIAIFKSGYLSPPFRIELSHALPDLTARRKVRRKAQRKKWDEPCQANRTFCLFFLA